MEKTKLARGIRNDIQMKREEINLADFNLTTASDLSSGQSLPLLIQPALAGVNLIAWAGNNKASIQTELALHGAILFHNESSHMHRWPMKIFFYCVKSAEKQGATPILDCRKTYQSIDPAII